MQQHISLHILGYSILANFQNENSILLLNFSGQSKMHVNSCDNINLHTTLD